MHTTHQAGGAAAAKVLQSLLMQMEERQTRATGDAQLHMPLLGTYAEVQPAYHSIAGSDREKAGLPCTRVPFFLPCRMHDWLDS